MKEIYNLTMDATKDLFSSIQIGFIYKTQTSSDVVFKNKRIDSIRGIVYCEKNKKFINEFINNIDDQDEKEDNNTYMYDMYLSV